MWAAKPCAPPGMVAAPPVFGIPVAGAFRQRWSTGLFDCLDDCHICLLTYRCPCITFGRIAEIVDRGATSCGTSGTLYAVLCFTGCHWIYSCTYRSKMRALLGLPDVGCCDCCVHLCCEPCALCQEYRELKARGFYPELGWDIHAQKAAANAAGMYPPTAQWMGR